MPKRTQFTNITPLPAQVSREVAVAMLHNHDEMIELNPLVIEHHPIKTPRDAPADEFLDCVWQELTDKIHYLPGGIVKGKVSYKACFRDTLFGVQTHIYAPMGLEIKEQWSIGGTLPGEPSQPRELGLNLPREGLYLREDCDMKCSLVLNSFVRKNLDNSHKVLVERIMKKAERIEEHLRTRSPETAPSIRSVSTVGSPSFQRGSHMSLSQFINSPRRESFSPPLPSPAQSQFSDTSFIHPAFRNDVTPGSSNGELAGMPPPYQSLNDQSPGYPRDLKQNPYLHQQPRVQKPPSPPASIRQETVAELPGSGPTEEVPLKLEQTPSRPLERYTIQNLEVPSFDQRSPRPRSREGKSCDSELLQSSPVRHSDSSRPPSDVSVDSEDDRYTEVSTSSTPKPTFQQYQAQRLGFI